jgi:hypothetical protein
LPGAVRITEIDRQPREDLQVRMPRHLRTLIPGKRSAKMAREFGDASGNRIANRLGTMSGEREGPFF